MSNAVYPYRIEYERTANWWANKATGEDGDWAKISNWCNECIGAGNWEYYNSEFVFSDEKHYMLFKLRWL
jgi:hypothetical protein